MKRKWRQVEGTAIGSSSAVGQATVVAQLPEHDEGSKPSVEEVVRLPGLPASPIDIFGGALRVRWIDDVQW